MIIGLNGRLKSGKDTTFTIIQEIMQDTPMDVVQVSFARKLKESAAASIGLDVATLEMLKAHEDLFYELELPGGQEVFRFNIREYLQWYGTEGHRNIFGDDFWVDMAMPVNKNYNDALYVVTDMRFPNECERVRFLGGKTVRVMRDVETSHSTHASEQNIDHMIDYFLDNTGSIDDLRRNVGEMLAVFNEPFVVGV